MSRFEPGSGSESIFPVSLEEDLSELRQIPIGGIEPDVDNLSPLLEEPIESPFAETVTFAEAPEAIPTSNDTDIITGMTKGDPNIPLQEESSSPIKPRKKKKTEPGNNAAEALNLGEIGKRPTKYNEEIGFGSGGSRDKSDYYEFTLKGKKKEEFNDLSIVLDGLRADANIQLLDEDGQTIIDQSREKGKKKEEISQILNDGTYYLKVEPKGRAKTPYSLSLSSGKVKDEDGQGKDATNLGQLKNKPQRINDDVGFQLGSIRDQKDFFEFSLNKDSEVTITLDALREDADLKLLNKKGGLLFSSSNENRQKEEINTVLKRGSYFVEVAPDADSGTNYRLSLSADDEIEDRDGQIPGTNLGKLQRNVISKTDDIGFKRRGFTDRNDFWKFELAKETDVSITLDSLRANADLELYGSDGLILSSTNQGRTAEEIETILDKGTYYVGVKSVGGNRTNYRLSLSGDTDIVEPDDRLPGTPLENLGAEEVTKRNKIGFGKGSVRDLKDHYSFSLGEKSDVNITLDNLSANAKLELLGTDGRTIKTSDKKGRANETIDRIISPGDYFVKVSPVGASRTKYDLGLTVNPAVDDYRTQTDAKDIGILYEKNTYEETNEIGFKRGSVPDSADYFHFELTQSQQISISLDGLTQNAGLQLLGGKDGKKQTAISNEKGRKPEIINEDLEPGSYYVKVFPVGKAKTGYELSFETLAPDKSPRLVNPLKDVTAKEDVNPGEIDISKVFRDPDSTIEKIEVTGNTNPALVTPTIDGNTLSLSLGENRHGDGEITITATSKGKTASDTFAVNVEIEDDPPELTQEITDVTVEEDADDYEIDLSNHFTDIDSELTYKVATNSNGSLLASTVNGNLLTLEFFDDQSGTAEITVEANGDGKLVSDTFTVTVNPVDDGPFVEQPIADVTVEEDATNKIVDLSSFFKDIDSKIALDVSSNDNPNLVNANLDGNNLTLDFLNNQSGLADITVTATSEGKSVSDSFTVNVEPVDDPPRLIKEIGDVAATEDDEGYNIDLAQYFEDVDSAVNYSVTANNNPSLVNANPVGNNLTLDYLDNQNGSATITVRAESNGLTADDTFTVNVAPADDSPVVANAIADVAVNEDAAASAIGLSNVFTDIDNDDAGITKAVVANSNPSLVNPVIEGNNLILSYAANQSGAAEIVVEGTSNGLKVSDTLTVTVSPIDDPLQLTSPIADLVVNEDAANTTIDLSNHFTDIDSPIAFTTQTNSNPGLVSAAVDGNNLILDYLDNQFGTAEITVGAESNGITVADTLTVTVNPVDDLLELTNPITDIAVDEDFENSIIDLAQFFTDIDDSTIAYNVATNTAAGLVEAIVAGTTLTLDYLENQFGSTDITVAARTRQTVNDTFTVNVNPVDDAPVVANPIVDLSTVNEDSAPSIIDLSSVFSDIDSDDAAITKTVIANSNSALVNPVIEDNSLTLNYGANQYGAAEITVEGTSNGLTVSDTFAVNVAPVDDSPAVANPIADVVVNEDAAATAIDLSSVFGDIDSDDAAIIKAVTANSNPGLVTPAVEGNKLTLNYGANAYGVAEIAVEGTSNGQKVSDTFTVTVNPIDDPPAVVNAIADVVVNEDAAATAIDLSSVFGDIDSDDAAIAKAVTANSNPGLVTPALEGNKLTLNYVANAFGTAEITIEGTSNGLTVNDTFAVTVAPVDDAPVVPNAIADLTTDKNEASAIDLSKTFTDIDNNDANIAKAVIKNSNPTLVTKTVVEGNKLTLEYAANVWGKADITVEATSNGKKISDTFTVVKDVAPVVAKAIADLSVDKNQPSTIDLSGVFTDVDNDNAKITKAVKTNSNPTLVTKAVLAGDKLTLEYAANVSGKADITVEATSNGKTVSDVFTVTKDVGPGVAKAIADVKVEQDSANTTIDLSQVFADVDNDDTKITKKIKTNSNSSLVAATVSGNTLTLDYQNGKSGNADITVEGTSNGKTVTDTFAVSVTGKPDLTVQKAFVSSTAYAGSAFSVSANATNIGEATAGASYLRYYLSDDTTLNSSDTYLGSDSVGSLSSYTYSPESASLTVPANATTGTKYLFFYADPDQEIAESNESNNYTYQSFYVYGRPDLTVQSYSVPSSATAGQSIDIAGNVNNNGGASADTSYVKYYLSDDTAFSSSDTFLGSDFVTSLDPGKYSYESASVTIPSTTSSGTKYILFVADASGTVTESKETNNVSYKSLYVYGGPDLTVQSPSAPTSANAGSSISISSSVKNIGGSIGGSSYVDYYLSDDTTLSSSDTYLGYDFVSSLDAGNSSYNSAYVIIPPTTSSGTKYLLFAADSTESVTESNESNNVAYQSITINNYPDLVVQNTSVPSYGYGGSSIFVNGTVKNSGVNSADSSYLHYYLSANTTFSTYDTYLGSDFVSSLSAGNSSYESASLILPSSASGTNYLFFVADANSAVTESNESNNLAYQPIYIY